MAEVTLLERLQQKAEQERQAMKEMAFRLTCLDQAVAAIQADDIDYKRLERKSEDFTDTITYAHEFRNELPTPETIGAETYKALQALASRGPVSIDTLTKYVRKKYPQATSDAVRTFLQIYQNDRRRPRNIRKVRPGYYALEVKGPRRLLIEGKAPRGVVQDTIAAAVESTLPRGKELKGKKAPTYGENSLARKVIKFLEEVHRVVGTKEIRAHLAAHGHPIKGDGPLAFLYTDHRYPGCPFKKVGPGQWAAKGLRGVGAETNGNGHHG